MSWKCCKKIRTNRIIYYKFTYNPYKKECILLASYDSIKDWVEVGKTIFNTNYINNENTYPADYNNQNH